MQTDKQIFQVFQAQPSWLFELTGLPSPGRCELRSLTVKELERRADGLVVPLDPLETLTLVEFQFQADPEIYLRIAEAMAAAQRAYGLRPVQGFVFFGRADLDPQTEPWTQIVPSFVLLDLLREFESRQPDHPLVAVFQPLLQPDSQTLEKQAVNYYRAIKTSKLKPREKTTLLDVFVNWLEQRFRTKNRQEIEAMLITELPSLEETESGKDLIRLGEARGEKRGEERGLARGEARGEARGLHEAILLTLEAKIGQVSKALKSRIERLSIDTSRKLLVHLLNDGATQKSVKAWLDQHAS